MPGPVGQPLAGNEPGQSARRRWYFSHYKRLREGHERAASRHRERAERAESAPSPDVRSRNAAKEERYYSELREWEAKRIKREEARAKWEGMRSDIITSGAGGIKSSTIKGDYQDIPISLRRANGTPLDTMGEHFGYSYQDDFVRDIRTSYDAYKRSQSERLVKPKRPKFEREPRRRLTAAESAARKQRRREIRELREMIYEGEKELGRDNPALEPLWENLAELEAENATP